MSDLRYKSLDFKAATGGNLAANQFDGYASTFLGPVDSYGDIIAPGAFKNSLDWFLDNGVLLREHKMAAAIGKPVEVREDKTGLYLKGQISETADGKDALTLLRDGVIKRMSIGFKLLGYEVLSKDRGIEVLGSEKAYEDALKTLPWYIDSLTLLTDIQLYEVSLVAFPANEAAVVSGVKSALRDAAGQITTERQFERFLRDAGFSATEAKTIVSAGYKALATPSGTDEAAEALKAAIAALRY